MRIGIFRDAAAATRAAADDLSATLSLPNTRTLMVAGGNTPIDLYREIAGRGLPLRHLNVFVLDEYVGVPDFDPRTCTNLLRRTVAEAWNVPAAQYFGLSPVDGFALASVRDHEARIGRMGGLDAIILGLGRNGHLGFNEPGSEPESGARVLGLDESSIQANRRWFGGDYAPSKGATVGLSTVVAARHTWMLAFGEPKAAAVRAMVKGPPDLSCPASWLQGAADVRVFLDRAAAAGL